MYMTIKLLYDTFTVLRKKMSGTEPGKWPVSSSTCRATGPAVKNSANHMWKVVLKTFVFFSRSSCVLAYLSWLSTLQPHQHTNRLLQSIYYHHYLLLIIYEHVYSPKQQRRQTEGQTHTHLTSMLRYVRHKTKVFRLSDLHNS